MTTKRDTDAALRFITRMHDPIWRVIITFGSLDTGSVYFTDRTYGGKEASLAAATAYRDMFLKANDIPARTYKGSGFYATNKACKSGMTGVQLWVNNKRNPTIVSWLCDNMVDGKKERTGRSIRRHGYVGAWLIVAAIRAKHTGIAAPLAPPDPPEWLREWAAERGAEMPERRKSTGAKNGAA